ncbi:MP domain-containing protein, partial [Cephalotus follicularis]
LQDVRHLNFDDYLIGAIETSLCNGPVYFDGYSDLTISLTDKNILKALKINIKLHGYNILHGSEKIAIIHHVHYIATNSICPKSLVNMSNGEITMMKCVTNDSNILIPHGVILIFPKIGPFNPILLLLTNKTLKILLYIQLLKMMKD